jgi:hypothetical protein
MRLATLITLAISMSSPADAAPPAQQSDCEVRANIFAAQHPHSDPFDYLKYGFFYFGKTPPPRTPSTYRDPVSGIVVYVESDGRHLAAIGRNGKLLWVRNPFVETDMCPYRSAHPYIYWIGPPDAANGWQPTPPSGLAADKINDAKIAKELRNKIARGRKTTQPRDDAQFIGLSFNSSQFGYVNIANGDFYEMGQN